MTSPLAGLSEGYCPLHLDGLMPLQYEPPGWCCLCQVRWRIGSAGPRMLAVTCERKADDGLIHAVIRSFPPHASDEQVIHTLTLARDNLPVRTSP